MREGIPRVVIVGGGFGGLGAAKALRNTPAQIILIDRTNHHLFQPLLYQVATSVLTPGQIGSPIRGILRNQKNTIVILGEVTGVDKDQKCVFVSDEDREGVPITYDYLILATGMSHSYFGHNEFEQYAPGLKTLADAVAVRNKILQAFEQAEAEEDPSRHRDLLTFVLVGAGPTGVEMAGAIAVLVRNTLRLELRRIDPASARIVRVDMGNRVLGSFPERLSKAAQQRLEKLGVEEIVSGEELGDFASKIKEEIAHRAYELFEAGGYQDGRDLEDWLRAESELLHPVEVKTWESEREVYVTAEIPGFRAEEVKIGVKPRRVIIWVKSSPEQGRSEEYPRRAPVALCHPLDLPAEIDPSKTSARLSNALLKLELPKVVQ